MKQSAFRAAFGKFVRPYATERDRPCEEGRIVKWSLRQSTSVDTRAYLYLSGDGIYRNNHRTNKQPNSKPQEDNNCWLNKVQHRVNGISQLLFVQVSNSFQNALQFTRLFPTRTICATLLPIYSRLDIVSDSFTPCCTSRSFLAQPFDTPCSPYLCLISAAR